MKKAANCCPNMNPYDNKRATQLNIHTHTNKPQLRILANPLYPISVSVCFGLTWVQHGPLLLQSYWSHWARQNPSIYQLYWIHFEMSPLVSLPLNQSLSCLGGEGFRLSLLTYSKWVFRAIKKRSRPCYFWTTKMLLLNFGPWEERRFGPELRREVFSSCGSGNIVIK